jgi:hypothetical protein
MSCSNILQENVLSLTEAAKIPPPARGGKKCHISTLLRWILKGAKSPTGERVRLEGVRLGERWVTSREALQRFVERLTPQLDEVEDRPVPTTPRQRQLASERAAAELDRIGF